ncbi:MAG: threonine/serine exporter family protein [Oscillospiraceae bacterium]|nr:threonine/serine exporter family protein [Oscillospiraceae bacterium]
MSWTYFLPCLWAFFGCLGFCLIFNIRSAAGMALCGLGGSLGWLVYLLGELAGWGTLVCSFFAAVAVSIYSEGMARVRKCPATGYLTVSLIPLVPGAGIYYTMEYALQGQTQRFLEQGMLTLGAAVSLAAGVLVVSSAVRIYYLLRRRAS